MRPRRLRIVLGAACIAALSSCGGDAPTVQAPVTPVSPATPTTPTTASLFIDSIVPRVYVGRTGQLAFEVRDKNGAAITGRTVAWSSSAPTVVTVSSSALLTGVSAGTATITGTVDGASATRIVSVLPIPSAVIGVAPDVAALARGVDLPLTASVTDIDGKALTGHSVTFASSDAAIATVSASGVVHPIANGSVNVVATVDGQQQATTHLTVFSPTTVNGVVATSDGGAIPALNFTARFSYGAALPQTFTTTIDRNSGAFALVVPALTTAGPAMEFYADVPAGAQRLYHPSWLKLNPGFVPNGSRILLIPHSIAPDSGTYAGLNVAVSMNEAFTPVCSDTSNQNCQSYWPSYFLTGIKNWADASRPIALALDRTTGNILASDSIALWDIIHTMEADLGRKLYRPATFTAFTTPGYTTGMVLVSYDPSLTGFAGFTNWSWDAQGVVYQARARFSQTRYITTPTVLTHELNHALGFHHTCRWATVMGGYGCGQDVRMSGNDVAYFHLAEQVRRQVVAFKANWSISEALAGSRIFELGFPTTSALPIVLSPLFSKTFTPQYSDGAP